MLATVRVMVLVIGTTRLGAAGVLLDVAVPFRTRDVPVLTAKGRTKVMFWGSPSVFTTFH